MSAADKDMNLTETEAHPPSDLNIDNEPPIASTTTATAATSGTNLGAPASPDTANKKPPGSPQTTAEDQFRADNVASDELEPHLAAPATVTATEEGTTAPVVAPLPTATATAPITVAPTAAPLQTVTAPASEREAKLAILTEAFPTVEKEVCEFVLESHRGDVEASINALLEISDPDFQPERQQQTASAPALAPAVAAVTPLAPSSGAPPALPRRQDPDSLSQGMAGMNLGHNQGQRTEIDPVFLASTSTSEQQLRADEDFARTLAAMDEYRARDNQNVRNQQNQQQQQHEEGPSFATEIKDLMDEELPKIKERFNVAADTTKKKVTEWYNQFKASRAEATQRNNANQGQYSDSYRNQGDQWSNENRNLEPIRFGSRTEEDEPLARHRVTPPLSGSTPPLPDRPYNLNSSTTADPTIEPAVTSTNSRRTTLEDDLETALNAQPAPHQR
ncbi:hypothetical protein BC939DRAFT_455901 [Gamsiella multidivaricata]|uniref:uncharacterized protein n=1 Tax=Gamsiella multidivaricata TaxID=101098 RepID=UPI00221ED0B9|nr:uncharacterized protein BC939DRAFT_455901 [Gamsiella multidivaricata]KAG0365168.1 hypothetical protein BGZ54_006797 [Gamsiella multidivaricata]KAI7821403.1 hypothetical protein BC939DRAFT_455901 [Gamsiella multidivaricata]